MSPAAKIFSAAITGLLAAHLLHSLLTGNESEIIKANNTAKKNLQHQIDSLGKVVNTKEKSLQAGLEREAELKRSIALADSLNNIIIKKIHPYAKADHSHLPADSQQRLFADKAARFRASRHR